MAEDNPTTSAPSAGATEPAAERAPSAESKAGSEGSAPEAPVEKETENSNGSEEKPAESAPEPEKKEQTETQTEEPSASAERSDAKEQEESTAAAPEGADAAPAPEAPAANGTPASAKKARRKSSGIPEHKSKLSRRKSQARITNLHAKPGEYYLAHLRSFPPWPSIICDEEMLPQSLLDTRPVTAMRPDGTYREDYADGGKRAHERTFPVMFFGTNEFAWMPNTDLKPIDAADCKDIPEKGKSKSLLAAYAVAAEGHDLQYFKNLLAEHQRAVQLEAEEREAKAAAKAEREAKKKKRKSMDVVEDYEDEEMEDVEDEGKTAKATKKRKKGAADSDVESDKPAKTPKTATKLKLTTPKTPAAEEATKKTPSAKPKQTAGTKKGGKVAVSDEGEEDTAPETKEPEKQVDQQEAKAKKEKEILFIRHKLQKCFISREHTPKEEEMAAMANFFTKLEGHPDLEVSIIRKTRINKVLKMIVKLPFIPREEEFQFRRRAVNILGKWKNVLDADTAAAGAAEDKEKKANGVHKEEDKTPVTPTKTEAEEEKKGAEEKQTKEEDTSEPLDEPMPDAEAEAGEKAQAPEAAEEPSKEAKETEEAPELAKEAPEPAKEAPEPAKESEAAEAPKESKAEEKTAETTA